ncbi:hypothetical protein BCAR13_1280019 [Paraburkholderia caribensis]|nr:hypothetical protein BCAR13_1280019 [Paraburkholderia caribensis]
MGRVVPGAARERYRADPGSVEANDNAAASYQRGGARCVSEPVARSGFTPASRTAS